MSEAMNNNQLQTCPKCDNHCPVDDLQCGRGRKYFGVADGGHEHSHDHNDCCGNGHPKSGLGGLLHQCGRFVRHAEQGEDELFQALTNEEKTTLQALLEKLAADWRGRCGEENFGCHGHHYGHEGGKHHKHEGHSK